MQNDLFDQPGHVVPPTCPDLSRDNGTTGTHPFRGVPLSRSRPGRLSKAQRDAAWRAWEDAGKPWNPEQDQPPGAVLDHALDACAADPMRAKWRR